MDMSELTRAKARFRENATRLAPSETLARLVRRVTQDQAETARRERETHDLEQAQRQRARWSSD